MGEGAKTKGRPNAGGEALKRGWNGKKVHPVLTINHTMWRPWLKKREEKALGDLLARGEWKPKKGAAGRNRGLVREFSN